MNMKVPFLDLAAHHSPRLEEFTHAIKEVILEGAFAGGPHVAKFESEFAQYCESRHAIGVGSGTEALWLALLAMGVGPGDEVITVPNSFMATAEAITYCGARPVFVDVDPVTFTMAPSELEKAITPATKAVIPVHLFGQPADMEPIQAIAHSHGLWVIADACQAHGARYRGANAALWGDAVCYSFYPGKNLGAFGEAGAIVTNNDSLLATIRTLRDHGQVRKYHHTLVGWNCRMDGIQAAILRIKLRHLEEDNRRRRLHAATYDRALDGLDGIFPPKEAPYARHVYHVYAIRCRARDRVMDYLHQQGVDCGIHYPVPIHLQEAYGSLNLGAGSYPVAEQCAREFLSLPMYPELSQEQLQTVVHTLQEAVRALGALSSAA
jgi:dTDP-4-amino-4,6-dideoxygalactose transaminase